MLRPRCICSSLDFHHLDTQASGFRRRDRVCAEHQEKLGPRTWHSFDSTTDVNLQHWEHFFTPTKLRCGSNSLRISVTTLCRFGWQDSIQPAHYPNSNIPKERTCANTGMAQTMLLTKRLTAFLSQNTTPQVPTLLLISPTGKLLASASSTPTSKLRTQSTLACTLWNLYQPYQNVESHVLTDALDTEDETHGKSTSNGDPVPTISKRGEEEDPCSITIQLTEGVMVIRGLKCQLLFVAIGTTPSTQYPTSPKLHAQAQHLSSSSFGSPPASPAPGQYEGQDSLSVAGQKDNLGSSYHGSTGVSEVGSVNSTARKLQANVLLIKRQADEVGKWLEKSLEGFQLSTGEVR